MQIAIEPIEDSLVITPALVISAGECGNPYCKSKHWRISVSWLFWELCLYLG